MCNKLLCRRSAYGTNVSTSAALDASVGVDLILAVALGDSAYRALIGTSAARDTIVRNLISHDVTSLNLLT